MAEKQGKLSEMGDHFELMGIPADATYDELRKAYIRLAKQYHPDKNGDVEIFKRVNAAYVAIAEKMAVGTEGRGTPYDEKLLGYFLGSTENKKSVTIKIPTDAISKWHKVLTNLYGPPKEQPGGRGDKYIAEKCVEDEDGPLFGTVHITVYHTGSILVQGSAYLFWHATCLPHILRAVCDGPTSPLTAIESEEVMAEANGSSDTVPPGPTGTPPEATSDRDRVDSPRYTHKDCNKHILDRLDALEINLVQTLDRLHRENQALHLEAKGKQIASLTTEIESLKRELRNMKDAKIGADQEREELIRSQANLKQELEKATSDKAKKKLQTEMESLQLANTDLRNNVVLYKARHQELERENGELIKSKQAASTDNSLLYERLAKKDAELLTAETALEKRQNELQIAQEEVKDLNVQLRTVWEHGTANFQPVTHSRKQRAPQATPTERADDAVHTEAEGTEKPATNNTEIPERSCDQRPTHRDLSSRAPPSQQPPTSGNKRDGEVAPDDRPKPDTERHLIITSSLGRNLDGRRLLPGNSGRIYVEAISGGKIQDVESTIKRTNGEYKTITVLAGGNNISSGDSVDSCIGKFESLIQSCKRHHASTRINVCEIPPRPAQHIRNKLVSLNEGVRSLCSKHDSVQWTPVQIDASDKFFVSDRIHLSRLGTSQLALDIRHAIDSTKPTRALGLPNTHPSSDVTMRDRGNGPRGPDRSADRPTLRRQEQREDNAGAVLLVKLLSDALNQSAPNYRMSDTRPGHYPRRGPDRRWGWRGRY